jgi:hypothetical protein
MLDPMPGDQSIAEQQQNRASNGKSKAADTPTVHSAAPPQSTTYKSTYQGSRNTQDRSNDKAAGIASWHKQLGNGSRNQSKDDPTDNLAHKPPFATALHDFRGIGPVADGEARVASSPCSTLSLPGQIRKTTTFQGPKELQLWSARWWFNC